MTISHEYLEFIIDQLAPLGRLSTRRMFGSVGIYCDGLMFALLETDQQFFIKVDDVTRSRFEDAGFSRFTYQAKGKEISLSYYAVPESMIDNQDELLLWARLGVDAALRAPVKKTVRARRQ